MVENSVGSFFIPLLPELYMLSNPLHDLKDLYSIISDGVNGFRTGCWVCTLIKRDKSLEN